MYQTVLPKIVECNRLVLHSSEKSTEKTRFFKMRYPNKNIYRKTSSPHTDFHKCRAIQTGA